MRRPREPLLPSAKTSTPKLSTLIILPILLFCLTFREVFHQEVQVGTRGSKSRGKKPVSKSQSPRPPIPPHVVESARKFEKELSRLNAHLSYRDRGTQIMKMTGTEPYKLLEPFDVLSPEPMPSSKGYDDLGLPILTWQDQEALGPQIKSPTDITPWSQLEQFVKPTLGGKNLFLGWLGPEPPPIFYAFIHTTYRNRGGFTMHLITDQNKLEYMVQEVNGKPICSKEKSPPLTHVAWKVCEKVLEPWLLPFDTQQKFLGGVYSRKAKRAQDPNKLSLVTQKDFIVNVMVALYGGVHMDPGILGPGKLDFWWHLMLENDATYFNYAFGAYREDKYEDDRARLVVFDKKGDGKWNGDLWIDSYFGMAPVGSCVMQCWLYLVANDPNWGPGPTQPNRSNYFIYGGDILDSCFASCHERKPGTYKKLRQDFPYGVNLYPSRSSEVVDVSNYSSQSSSQAGSSSQVQHVEDNLSVGRSLTSNEFEDDLEDIPNFGGSDPEKWAEELSMAFAHMFRRMEGKESAKGSSVSGVKDPPNVNGIKLPFPPRGNAIIIDARTGHPTISAGMIRQPIYTKLAMSIYPDFWSMLSAEHPMASLTRDVLDALLSPYGTMYIKFYNTAGSLKQMPWESLCGPPITFAMFILQQTTGQDICTGEKTGIIWSAVPVISQSSSSEVPPGDTGEEFVRHTGGLEIHSEGKFNEGLWLSN